MPTRDVVELTLSSPIDWENFEKLVVETLVQDDLPRLQKLGGVADRGADAVEEAFYGDDVETSIVVQITSSRAQVRKLTDTIQRLQDSRRRFKRLVLVYRHPVSSETRLKLQEEGVQHKVAVDVRDQFYLVTQLAKPPFTVFQRYFGDARKQLDILFSESDPLGVLHRREKLGMLASLGAYVIHPRARIVRKTLFEKTILGILAGQEGPVSLASIIEKASELIPGEAIEENRVKVALSSLREDGACQECEHKFQVTEEARVQLGKVIAQAKSAYRSLVQYVTVQAGRGLRLDDAMRGYLERNVRLTVLSLVREYGGLGEEVEGALDDESRSSDLERVMSKNLPADVGKRALFALATFVGSSENRAELTTFVRSYSALAIRNMDPIGRRWQSASLGRSTLALDTDAVLYLMIEELPEHPAMLQAVRALQRTGVEIVVPESVLREVVGHLGRANKTYERFRGSLLRMSPSMVDGDVWHTVVRGYYYSRKSNRTYTWRKYWSKYYDRDREEEFAKFVLGRRIEYQIKNLQDIPAGWHADFEVIASAILKEKEARRRKAVFRDEEQMEERVRSDVRLAFHLSSYDSDGGLRKARGYVASSDFGFRRMEEHVAWGNRERVFVLRRSLPGLAEFVCGESVADDILVRLMFDPVIAVTAHLADDEIRELTRIGVDLRDTPLDRLEWDLTTKLKRVVLEIHKPPEDDRNTRVENTLRVLGDIQAAGYQLDSRVAELEREYERALQRVEEESKERAETQDKLKEVAIAAAGYSRKGRRRVAAILRDYGIALEEFEAEGEGGGET